MGLTTSAIPEEESEEDLSVCTFPLEELTPEFLGHYLNEDVLIDIEKWAFTRDFTHLLATCKKLQKFTVKVPKEVVRTTKILKLMHWVNFPMVKEVVLFHGNEPFIPKKAKLPTDQCIWIPFLTVVTCNDNVVEFIVTSYHLGLTTVRLEFIIDDLTHRDFPSINVGGGKYEYTELNLFLKRRFIFNPPKELEIILIDEREGHSGERIGFDKTDREDLLITSLCS